MAEREEPLAKGSDVKGLPGVEDYDSEEDGSSDSTLSSSSDSDSESDSDSDVSSSETTGEDDISEQPASGPDAKLDAPAKPVCKFFAKTGKCKFGNNCHFTHVVS